MAQDRFVKPFFDEYGNPKWPEEVPEWAGGPEESQEFFQALRDSWIASSDYRQRMLVAENGGPDEWSVLLHDENDMVRAAVAMAGDAPCHQALAQDASPLVREYVARFSRGKALVSMAGTEQDKEVIVSLARRKIPEVAHILVEKNWDKPEILSAIMPYVGNSDREKLLSHSDPNVRRRVGEYGTRKQVRAVLADKEIPEASKIMVQWRLEDLEEIAAALAQDWVRDQVRERVQQPELSR